MPWIEPPTCTHPDRPTPTVADNGRIWECEGCTKRWQVFLAPPLMPRKPGEYWQAIWREL